MVLEVQEGAHRWLRIEWGEEERGARGSGQWGRTERSYIDCGYDPQTPTPGNR